MFAGAPTQLEWRDLLFLHTQNFVLRCAPVKRAREEKLQGGNGDFISLATFAVNPWQDKEFIDNLSAWEILDEYYFRFQLSDEIHLYERNACIERMENCIKRHIHKAFLFKDKPAVMLAVHQHAKNPVDISNSDEGYPLGKFETYLFSSKCIQCVIEVEEEDDLIMQKKLFNKLIVEIKRFSQQYWNNPVAQIERDKIIGQLKHHAMLAKKRKALRSAINIKQPSPQPA